MKSGIRNEYRTFVELREKLGLPTDTSNAQIMLALLERIERLEAKGRPIGDK